MRMAVMQRNQRWPGLPCGAGGALALLSLMLLPAVAVGSPRQDGGGGYGRSEARTQPAAHHKDAVHYKYQYAVDDPVSGVVNDRWEQRSGDFVKGQYSLLDPDGKVRTVDYEVDGERGFHAVIRTQYPAPSLLSIQSASQVHEVYQDSPVNLRAKNGVGIPDFALRDPRFSVRDNLPFNYHALDAAKLGIDTEDGAHLQHLDDEADISPKEAQRRKYHRENHLRPHEQLYQQQLQQLQDQSFQQDTRQELQEPSYSALPSRNIYTPLPSPSASVYNPRAAYISLRPQPPRLSPLPPPNPPPQPSPSPARPVDIRLLPALRRGAALPTSASSSAFLFQPAPPSLHTLALFQPQASSRSSVVSLPGASRSPSRPRIVQHLTETSPGLTSSRSYYLR